MLGNLLFNGYWLVTKDGWSWLELLLKSPFHNLFKIYNDDNELWRLSKIKLVMLHEEHLTSWWFMSTWSISIADFLALFVGRVICGTKLLDRTISEHWFTPGFYVLLIKVTCRVKTNTTWTTKNTTCFHYFSKKFKTNTLQGRKKYIKIFELEINNLCVQILAAKMT